jgi:hypothetical protein
VKRIIVFIISLVLAFSLAACAGRPGPDASDGRDAGSDIAGTDNGQDKDSGQEPGAVLTVKVMEIKDGSFLAASMSEGANAADIYMVSASNAELLDAKGSKTDFSVLKPGMIVDINYNGAVMESFPMQLGGIKSIRIREEGDDIAGLYMKVIRDLYEVDPGLNDDIERLAFNLNKTTNLKETEKTALVHMAGSELREQGYIDSDARYFKTGLLFIIEVESEDKDSFVFDAQKWRSGTGAYYFLNCTAKKDKSGWSYEIGGHAIS